MSMITPVVGQLIPIPVMSMPAPGQPPSAVDGLGVPGVPARMTKRNGYNAVEFCFLSSAGGSGTYALYTYWPEGKDWRPEGPRGATPTLIDTASLASTVPVRVSTKVAECEICLVLVSGSGVFVDSGSAAALVQEQVR